MAGKMGLPRNGLKRELEPELFELVVLGKQVAVTIALCYRRADVGSSVPLGA